MFFVSRIRPLLSNDSLLQNTGLNPAASALFSSSFVLTEISLLVVRRLGFEDCA